MNGQPRAGPFWARVKMLAAGRNASVKRHVWRRFGGAWFTACYPRNRANLGDGPGKARSSIGRVPAKACAPCVLEWSALRVRGGRTA